MKKILVISNTSFSIEKFRLHYLKKLAKKYDITICTPDKIKVYYNNISSKAFGFNNFVIDLYKINKILLRNNYDFILAYSFKYQFYIFFLNFFYKKKIVNIIAGKGSLFLSKKIFLKFFRDVLFKIFFKYSKYNVFINKYDKIFFQKKYYIKKKLFTIPTEGIEIKNFKQSKLNNKKFIFFARIIKEKGIREFIELADNIKKKYPNTKFFIAGTNKKNIVGQSISLSNNKHINDILKSKNVKYIGYQRKFIKVLPEMDCLISPSYSEGAGQSVIESIMCGLYAVVFKNSGHKYILNNQKKFICNVNSTKDLERLTVKFIKQKKVDSKKIVHKAQTYIKENFSSDKVYKKILIIINKIENS